ncbi:MAG: SDR family oxidoreductase [Saprospiraceae bacterium]|nr:SDR family oxidoreductase [Saprospiraceae bacterium]
MSTNKPYCLILGAEGDIGKAVAYRFAKAGFNLYLTSRNRDYINADENHKHWETDYQIHVSRHFFEALDFKSHELFYRNLPNTPEVVIGVLGYLGNQKRAQMDFGEAQKIINTNYTALVSILHIAANDMEKRFTGCIIGISSVAGERGRRSNYIYGSAKGAFTIFLSGLRSRLADKNVHVLTVKPGYIRTKMTGHMKLPKLLTSDPDHLATSIYAAMIRRKNVLYHLPLWQLIMFAVRAFPEFIFKRINF